MLTIFNLIYDINLERTPKYKKIKLNKEATKNILRKVAANEQIKIKTVKK